MARIITVFNQKGGVGKTTLSVHIAGTLAKMNHKVMLVDADPQGSAIEWIASANDGGEIPIKTANLSRAGRKLHKQVFPHVDENDFIVIDCPPSRTSGATLSALLVSDIALMPMNASPMDMWASADAETLLENALAINENLRTFVVWNQFDKRRVLAKGADAFLENMSIGALKSTVSTRESFRQAAIIGGLAQEQGDRSAKIEVEGLVNEILELLAEQHAEEV